MQIVQLIIVHKINMVNDGFFDKNHLIIISNVTIYSAYLTVKSSGGNKSYMGSWNRRGRSDAQTIIFLGREHLPLCSYG